MTAPVRLDELPAAARRIVEALWAAEETAKKKAGPDRDSGPAKSEEGSSNARARTR